MVRSSPLWFVQGALVLVVLGVLGLAHPTRAQFEPLNVNLDGVAGGDVAWADVDGDGDRDLLLIGNETGDPENVQPSATLYENQGQGTFSPMDAGVTGVSVGSAAFGDFDDDGDPDLVITGNEGGFSAENLPENSARIYENEGDGTFAPLNAGIEGVTVGAVDWADVDGDGDLDLVVAGNVGGVGNLCPDLPPIITPPICDDPDPSIRIYENEGGGSFSQIGAGIEEGVALGASTFGDIDDDGDPDLAVTGAQGNLDTPQPFSAVYENDGTGTFTQLNAGITDVAGRSAAWADVNDDASLDLIVAGVEADSTQRTRLYLNDGDGGFSESETGLENVAAGAISPADVDLDGDTDLALSGRDTTGAPVATVYENDGTGQFTPFNAGLTPVEGSAAAWGDAGGDVAPDLALVGRDADSTATATLYENQLGGIAEAQLIHNAADPAADTVDVYFGNERAFDDIAFRSATPFTAVPSGLDIEVGVAPSGSDGPGDVVASQTLTFDAGSAYTVVASGVLDPSEFADNPDGKPIAFEFLVEPGANTTAPGGKVRLRAVHGATDAPTVDIEDKETALFSALDYGAITPDYVSVDAEDTRLAVTPSGSDDPLAAFQADLSVLSGLGATMLASGFVDPTANQDGPPLRLIAARPNGEVTTFPPNQAPTVAAPLPDDTLKTPGPSLQLVGLGVTVFDDPDGDALTFSAASDNASVVDVVGDAAPVLLQPVGTGTAEITVTASDGVGAASTSFQATVEEREGDEPVADARALINASAESLALDFGDTGNRVVPVGIDGSGTIEARRFDEAPDSTEGIEEKNVSQYRAVIATDGGLDLGDNTEVRFPVEDFDGIEDPTQVTVYSRPMPGSGTFEALPTSVDENGTPGDLTDDEIVAMTGAFSEFVLASDTQPLPVDLADFTATRSGEAVIVQWATTRETNNAGFRVQYEQPNGWQDLDFVPSKAGDGTTGQAQSYRYTVDRDLGPGTHRFRLEQVDLDETTALSDTVQVEVGMEGALHLSAPAPNPASERATLSFAVQDGMEADIVMYDVLGQRVRTLYEGRPPGAEAKRLTVATGTLPSGVYVVRLRAGGQTRTERLTVVR